MRSHLIAIFSMAALSFAAAAAAAEPRSAHGSVTIHRDAMGVPHVFGTTSAEVMFGLGYALAEDRLAQMELARRGAAGTRAELLGPSAVEGDETARDRALGSDELMRMYRAIPAEHQEMMQGFVDGINRYIERVAADPGHLTPYEFKLWGIGVRPWTLLDYLAYVASLPKGRSGYELQNQAFLDAMIAQYGESTGRQIFEDVVPLNDPDSPTTIAAGEDLAPVQPMPRPGRSGVPVELRSRRQGATSTARVSGPKELAREASRCLVIGPDRSASGHILMMEATADGPEAHLYGGGFNTAGFAFAGWGPPTMGRSADHGWLLTSGHADTTDTYVERLNPKNRHQYWFRGAWRNMTHRSETIKVKGAAPVVHEVAATVHGPVVTWDVAGGVTYTQRYAERGQELDNWVATVEMARATNLADFESKGVARLAWNLGVCYGNTAGQFGFWEAGLLPKRPDGADSRLPTAGTGESEWTGFLDFKERPHVLNPKQGYIHTWNSKATSWMREGDEARIGKTFRTWLGSELAASGKALTLLDMREINRKIYNAFGAQELENTSPAFFAPYVRDALQHSDDPELERAGELMLSFSGLYEDRNLDGRYDNPGLTLFRTWLQVAPAVIFGPSIGDWWHTIDEPRYEKYQSSLLLRALQGDSAGLPLRYDYFKGRERSGVVIETLRRTLDTLRPKFPGKPLEEWRLPVFWKYFDPARETPEHPLLVGEGREPARLWATLGLGPVGVPHNGGEEWVGLYELSPEHPVLYSAVEAGGQSQFIDAAGRGSSHLTDQVALHANSEFKRIDMSPQSVERDAVTTTHLSF